MRRLILHKAPQDFDPEQDILIAPWCMIGAEQLFPAPWETVTEPDPFISPQALHKAGIHTIRYVRTLLPKIALHLNEANATTHSNKYWSLLLLNWLSGFVQTAYEKQCRINAVIEKYADEDLYVTIAPLDVEWNFHDSIDFFTRGTQSLDYSHWLLSHQLVSLAPPNWTLEIDESFECIRKPDTTFALATTSGKRQYKKRARCQGVYGIQKRFSMLISVLLNCKPPLKDTHPALKRKEASCDISFSFDIEDILKCTIPNCFSSLPAPTKNWPVAKSGKIRIVGPSMFFDEEFKRFLAYCEENGEHLICTQHGGSYGYSYSVLAQAEVEYSHRAFISWGWENHGEHQGNFIPLPSPMLSNTKLRKKDRKQTIMLIGTADQLFPKRIISIPTPAQNPKRLHEKKLFIENLSEKNFNRFMYRPYHLNLGVLTDKERFQKEFPRLKIAEGPLLPHLAKCSLLVLDHPGTTLCQAAAKDMPFIGMWDDASWPNTSEAAPYFQAMRDAGILFDTGREAAEKVESIGDNIEEWWQQDAIQVAVRNFRNTYASSSRFWLLSWLKKVWNI